LPRGGLDIVTQKARGRYQEKTDCNVVESAERGGPPRRDQKMHSDTEKCEVTFQQELDTKRETCSV